MLRDNWPVIDWREPIGLQERLEGRSSHNGEISVMSRSRFQGTEVTIVTGALTQWDGMNVLTPTCALRTSVTYTVKGSIANKLKKKQ